MASTNKYVGQEALQALVAKIKEGASSVYKVKGSCGYYDGESYEGTGNGYIINTDDQATAAMVTSGGTAITLEEGFVYNLTEDLTVANAAAWVDKAVGDILKAGLNIVVINTGTADTPVLVWDCLASDVDLSAYQTKALDDVTANIVAGNTVTGTDTFATVPTADYNYQVLLDSTAGVYKYWNGIAWTDYYNNSTGATVNATVLNSLMIISAYKNNIEAIKQDKELSTPIDLITPDHTYTDYASFPTTDATTAGVATGDIAEASDTGELYKATVDDTDDTISWTLLGGQTTVEGTLALYANVLPNAEFTAAEVNAMFN